MKNLLFSLGVAVLIGGGIMLLFGMKESESFGSDVSRLFTGHVTNNAMWLIIGGIGSLCVGTALMIAARRGPVGHSLR